MTDYLISMAVSWAQRLLPAYDYAQNLLHPRPYDSIMGALLNVMGVVISKVDEETRERGFIYRLGSWMFGLSSPADVSL